MHEEYEDYGDDSEQEFDEKYKHYFKFDPDAWDAWGKLLYDALGGIIDNPTTNTWYVYGNFSDPLFPVNSWNPNAGKTYQYLGSNYQGSQVWKPKYFLLDKIQIEYKMHLQANATHFIKQPTYYRGMFDILN